ncbi:membrane protein [Skermanella stibiiresistens SB22]|uniref:Probable membrane transporter protein n=1 Tax=Skermanella stibiiresistens SB22 TaxID=1385369 RepID=W9H5D6_9PROT|nr:sulfite exporter TauE/SafE family protein [Skermanella stibiiresistens]EWY38973.1 membrane protein [Skermanella stibiiresistens SB22]
MLSIALLVVAAFAAGVVNAIAGGGAFITFPALIFAGVPPVLANASSTVALFPGQATSALAYRRDILGITQFSLPAFIGLSLVGGLVGALLLLYTPNAVFADLVPWLMLFATVVFALGNFAPKTVSARMKLSGAAVLVVQFIISIYGGYFGGGIGFLMLAALTLFGMSDIHAMNGLKILLATLMNGAAVAAFIVAGAVHWPVTLPMALASVAGGYAGARGARLIDQKLLKLAVVVIASAMTVYFFWRQG